MCGELIRVGSQNRIIYPFRKICRFAYSSLFCWFFLDLPVSSSSSSATAAGSNRNQSDVRSARVCRNGLRHPNERRKTLANVQTRIHLKPFVCVYIYLMFTSLQRFPFSLSFACDDSFGQFALFSHSADEREMQMNVSQESARSKAIILITSVMKLTRMNNNNHLYGAAARVYYYHLQRCSGLRLSARIDQR